MSGTLIVGDLVIVHDGSGHPTMRVMALVVGPLGATADVESLHRDPFDVSKPLWTCRLLVRDLRVVTRRGSPVLEVGYARVTPDSHRTVPSTSSK
ncbi:MAG: hypothetical protein ACLP1X_11315 [Polyangiaceae bacterium]